MTRPLSCHKQVIILGTTLIQCAEACFDSSGNFYCTNLWYFWFGIFWFFIFIFIGVICIVNRYNKKKRQVDVEIELPPLRSTRARNNVNGTVPTASAESSA